MSIQSTKFITRREAISRIDEINELARSNNYREISNVTHENDEKGIDSFMEDITKEELHLQTDQMLSDLMSRKFYRESIFDNYIIEG